MQSEQIFSQEKLQTSTQCVVICPGYHGHGVARSLGRLGIPVIGVHACFTTYGTPVFVNKAIIESDLVIGVGGIYPNHTAGFGGGSKLALGVLGIRTIYHLHFRHKSTSWGDSNTDIAFRRELDEISKMIGMETNVSVIIDADRKIIRM